MNVNIILVVVEICMIIGLVAYYIARLRMTFFEFVFVSFFSALVGLGVIALVELVIEGVV